MHLLTLRASQATFGAVLLALGACSSSDEGEADRYIVEGSSTLFNPRGEFDEDAAREDAKADAQAESFQTVGDTSLCTEDCSGHDAGYEWAKENDITDASDCSGTSQSFIEGCEAFAQTIEAEVEADRDGFESGEE